MAHLVLVANLEMHPFATIDKLSSALRIGDMACHYHTSASPLRSFYTPVKPALC